MTFKELRVSPSKKDFLSVCLWGKLCVHSKVFMLLGTKQYPVCGADESVGHALGGCCFYNVVKHVLGVYWPSREQRVMLAEIFTLSHIEHPSISKSGSTLRLAREVLRKFG